MFVLHGLSGSVEVQRVTFVMAKFAIVDVSDISISAQVNLHMASYL